MSRITIYRGTIVVPEEEEAKHEPDCKCQTSRYFSKTQLEGALAEANEMRAEGVDVRIEELLVNEISSTPVAGMIPRQEDKKLADLAYANRRAREMMESVGMPTDDLPNVTPEKLAELLGN